MTVDAEIEKVLREPSPEDLRHFKSDAWFEAARATTDSTDAIVGIRTRRFIDELHARAKFPTIEARIARLYDERTDWAAQHNGDDIVVVQLHALQAGLDNPEWYHYV